MLEKNKGNFRHLKAEISSLSPNNILHQLSCERGVYYTCIRRRTGFENPIMYLERTLTLCF